MFDGLSKALLVVGCWKGSGKLKNVWKGKGGTNETRQK